MNIVRFYQQTVKLCYVLILLCLLAMNFGLVAGAEALLTPQENVVQVEETNEPPQITEGDHVTVTMSMNGLPTPFILTLHASDANNDLLTWQISVPAQNGAASFSGTDTTIDVNYIPNFVFRNGWFSRGCLG